MQEKDRNIGLEELNWENMNFSFKNIVIKNAKSFVIL